MGFRWLLVLLLLVPPEAWSAACTDGTDCYCDCVEGATGIGGCTPNNSTCFKNSACQAKGIPMDDKDYGCIDWEHEAWYEVTHASAWWRNSQAGFRGETGIWQTTFGPTNQDCSWLNGEPSSPTYGVTCGFSACAAEGDWRADNAFNANAGACLDIQRANELDDEISGLTLTGGDTSDAVFDGQTYLAERIPVGNAAAIASNVYGVTSGNDLGVTMAFAYSSNLLTANPNSSTQNGFILEPWKHFQSTGNMGLQWGGGNTGGPCLSSANGGGGVPMSAGHVGGTCSSISATVNVGCLMCQSSVVRWGAAGPGSSSPAANELNFATDWGLGKWACLRIYMEDPSDGTVSDYWIEFQGSNDSSPRLIFDVDNWNVSNHWSPSTMGSLVWDSYFNGNVGGAGDDPNIETFYRYNDNIHLRDGVPVSCAQIGFGEGAAPPGLEFKGTIHGTLSDAGRPD